MPWCHFLKSCSKWCVVVPWCFSLNAMWMLYLPSWYFCSTIYESDLISPSSSKWQPAAFLVSPRLEALLARWSVAPRWPGEYRWDESQEFFHQFCSTGELGHDQMISNACSCSWWNSTSSQHPAFGLSKLVTWHEMDEKLVTTFLLVYLSAAKSQSSTCQTMSHPQVWIQFQCNEITTKTFHLNHSNHIIVLASLRQQFHTTPKSNLQQPRLHVFIAWKLEGCGNFGHWKGTDMESQVVQEPPSTGCFHSWQSR